METYHFIWVLTGIAGLVAAGLAGSAWSLATGSYPSIWMLSTYSVTTPLRTIILCIYAPLGIVKAGLADLDENTFFALMLLALGMIWSFLQGVFILTTFFGFT